MKISAMSVVEAEGRKTSVAQRMNCLPFLRDTNKRLVGEGAELQYGSGPRAVSLMRIRTWGFAPSAVGNHREAVTEPSHYKPHEPFLNLFGKIKFCSSSEPLPALCPLPGIPPLPPCLFAELFPTPLRVALQGSCS